MNLKRWQENGIILGLLILIFPFFGLFFFVHPQGDDFFFVLKLSSEGAIDFVKDMYLNWSGRYFSMFLGALDPGQRNSNIPLRISLLLFQIIFIFSVFVFFRSISKKAVKSKIILYIAIAFYAIFLNIIPDALSFLYWYPSVSAYTIGSSLFLLFLSLNIFYYNNRISSLAFLLLAFISLILAIGSNELFIIPLGFASCIFILAKLINKKSISLDLLIFISYIIFSTFMVFAPGNFTRMTCYNEEISIFTALWLSIKSFLYICAYYLQNPSFILLSILIFISSPILKRYIVSFLVSKETLITVFLISIIFLSIALFPATYSLKCIPSYRVTNILAFFFLIIWLVNIYIISIYFSQINKINLEIPRLFIKIITTLIVTSIFTSIYITDFYKFKETRQSSIFFQGNILKAYYVLYFEAKTYDIEITNRYKQFENAKSNNIKVVKFKPLTYQPDILVEMQDRNVYSDSNGVINNGTFFRERRYYNLDTLIFQR